MTVAEIVVIGVALAMDACAVGLTNGITQPKMGVVKILLIAAIFALFQFFMPLVGYAFSAAFTKWVKLIAPFLSFFLLAVIGGKMATDSVREIFERRKGVVSFEKKQPQLSASKLILQAIATSLDALAVGVTFLAVETAGGLPFHVLFCSLIVGAVTFLLVLGAVFLGKKAGAGSEGNSEIAELGGGIVLIVIGLKILLEGILG